MENKGKCRFKVHTFMWGSLLVGNRVKMIAFVCHNKDHDHGEVQRRVHEDSWVVPAEELYERMTGG